MTRARDVANIDGLLTTTGDTYYASAAGTPARLGIGSSAQVLTVASGVPSWATPAAASGPAFSAYRTGSTQALTAATFTKAQLNAEHFDTDGCFDSTTNYRFTPTKAGKYQINVISSINTTSVNQRALSVVYLNGSAYCRTWDNVTGYAQPTAGGAFLLDMNGTTDYIELYAYSETAGNLPNTTSGSGMIFSATWIRS